MKGLPHDMRELIVEGYDWIEIPVKEWWMKSFVKADDRGTRINFYHTKMTVVFQTSSGGFSVYKEVYTLDKLEKALITFKENYEPIH